MASTATSSLTVHPNESGQHYEFRGPDSPTLHHGNRFLSALAARGLAATTIRACAFDLVVCSRWLARSAKTLEELEQSDLLELITAERQRRSHPRSINRRLTTFEAFYRFVIGHSLPRGKGVTTAAPYYKGRGYDRHIGVFWLRAAGPRALRVKVPRKLIEPLRTEQVAVFLNTIRRYRDLALVYLMLFCGLRSREVLGLRLGDIDVDSHSILIHGKGGKQRTVPLPPLVSEVLVGYLRCERPSFCLTDRVFVVLQGPHLGCPMTLAGLRSLFRHRRQRVQLAKANPHRFRHTFGADMARAGVSLSALQRLMGHCDAETTLRYINLSLEDVAAEYQRASAKIRARYEI